MNFQVSTRNQSKKWSISKVDQGFFLHIWRCSTLKNMPNIWQYIYDKKILVQFTSNSFLHGTYKNLKTQLSCTRSDTNLNGLCGSKNRKTKRTNFCFGWPRFNCGLFQVIIDCSEEFSSHDLRWYSILFRLYS